MKKLISLLIYLNTLIVVSQTKLDSTILAKINQYRKEMKLNEVKFDTASYKAAKHHTSFLFRKNKIIWPKSICGHNEDTLISHYDRYRFYSRNKFTRGVGEVSLSITKNYGVNDASVLEKISTDVLDSWKSSPKHNELLLQNEYTLAGVNCQYFTNLSGINTHLNYRIVSTMVLVK